jgi:MFS superfamily sulfate permease-like transporter
MVRVRFDRHELAGAFGDIGTDLPLLVALITSCHLNPPSVCILFGALQVCTGLLYGIPMPVQPLKAMAAIMLAKKLSSGTLAGGGLVIGVVMLALAMSGSLAWLARVVRKEVVRGIQLGLGISLATLALKDYVAADGRAGYFLAIACALALLLLRRQQRVPGPLVVIGVGVAYSIFVSSHTPSFHGAFGFSHPLFRVPTKTELVDGAILLALPQIPLSLGNSVIATSQVTHDLFPDRAVSVRKIGVTYGLMNLIAPWFGGVPVCHGCGGLAGFYGFGARTGGAPIIYGSLFLTLGLCIGPGFSEMVKVFPMPVLGVVLAFESIALMTMVRDVSDDARKLWIAVAVAAAVVGLPYGYLVGLVAGTLLSIGSERGWVCLPTFDGDRPLTRK